MKFEQIKINSILFIAIVAAIISGIVLFAINYYKIAHLYIAFRTDYPATHDIVGGLLFAVTGFIGIVSFSKKKGAIFDVRIILVMIIGAYLLVKALDAILSTVLNV